MLDATQKILLKIVLATSKFLPPNTTSKLQPLDLGIIQNFKVHYRTLLLRFVLSQIDVCDKASEVAKSVSILHSIRWAAQAWDAVSAETIRRCFRKAGILLFGSYPS